MRRKFMNNNSFVPCLVAFLVILAIIPAVTAGDVIPFNQSPLSQEYIVKGDPLTISGNVPSISEIRVWIFGPQYADAVTLPLQPDGSFGYNLTIKEIEKMESGNYTVVLQSSGENGKYDIALDERTGEVINTSRPSTDPDRVLFTLDQAKNMRSAAPDAIVRAIGNSAVDDRYAAFTFSIADPFIKLDPVRDYYVGETITISGWTNLPTGENVFFEITRGFKDYGETGDLVRQWKWAPIVKGKKDLNFFSEDFDSSVSPPAEYYVFVTSSWMDISTLDKYTTFTLLEGPPPATVPATNNLVVTTVLPTETTTPATTTPTTAPLPAILSVIAMVLIACAFLVGRRD